MAYVVTRFGIPFLSSLPLSADSGPSIRFADAAARLDNLDSIDRQILGSRLWKNLRLGPGPGYGSRLFADLRPKVVLRGNGGDVEKEIVWHLGGDGDDTNDKSGTDSIPSVLRVPASRLLSPPVTPPPESSTLTRLQVLPGGLELAHNYAFQILKAFGDGEDVSETSVERAKQFLQVYVALAETEGVGSSEVERIPPPPDETLELDLRSGVELFSNDIFDIFDSSSSSGGHRVVRLSAFFASSLDGVRRDTFSSLILDLVRAEELREEPVLREYLLKVAVIHLMRFSEIEDSERRRLRTEIFSELGESSKRSVKIDSISNEVLSVLNWMLMLYPNHPVLPFFKRAGSSGEGELIGVSGVIQFSDETLRLMLGDNTPILAQPNLEDRYPEVAALEEIRGGLSFFLPDPESGELKSVDLGFGRAWDFKTGGMGTLSLVERRQRLKDADSLDPLLLVAKRIRPDKRRSERQRKEAMDLFLKEAAIGEILGGCPHILSVAQVAWLGEDDPVAILRYLLPWHASLEGGDVAVNTLHDLIHSRIQYDFGLVLERMLLPVAQALVFAHTKGVVHYDVKPKNLFVEKREGETDPRAVLADWGMAEILRGNRRRSGALCGTPGYFFRRDLHGTLRDIRAFGITAYEAIARRHPVRTTQDYARDEVGEGLLTMVPWEDQVRPVRDLFPEIPAELESWIYGAMGYSQSEQMEQFGLDSDEVMEPYTSMSEVLRGLEQFIALDKARQSVGGSLDSIGKANQRLMNSERFPPLQMARAQFDSFRVEALAVHAEYEHVLSRLGNIDSKVLCGHQELLWRLYEEAEVFGLEMEIRPLLSRYDELVTRTRETGSLSLFPVGVDIDEIRLDLVSVKIGADNIFCEEILWEGQSLVESDLRLPKGVYYLRLCADGFVPIQLPVTVRRGDRRDIPISFYREETIPEGFAVIPGGKVIVEEYPDSFWSRSDRDESVQTFAVSQTMVTNGDYLKFIQSLLVAGKTKEAKKRMPRDAKGDRLWHEDMSGTVYFFDKRGRKTKPVEMEAPVIWISDKDALAWIQWKSGGKYPLRLPTRTEMLYLMRGTDNRKRPWGDNIQYRGAHVKQTTWKPTVESEADVMRVGSFLYDASPVSHPSRRVVDVYGNARVYTADPLRGKDGRRYRHAMGSGYIFSGDDNMLQTQHFQSGRPLPHGFFVVCTL